MEKKKYLVVASSCGEGMTELFLQMGADKVVSSELCRDKARLINALRPLSKNNILFLPCGKEGLKTSREVECKSELDITVIPTKSLIELYAVLQAIGISGGYDGDIRTLESVAENAVGIETDAKDELMSFIKKTERKMTLSAITLFVGRDVSHEGRAMLTEELTTTYKTSQLTAFLGGQRSNYCAVLE